MLPSTPKHKVLKNELCIILFRRENNNIYATLVEAMLKHYNDVKLASNPFCIVESLNEVKSIPPVKMYMVICDCEVSAAKTNGWELYVTIIKILLKITGMSRVLCRLL